MSRSAQPGYGTPWTSLRVGPLALAFALGNGVAAGAAAAEELEIPGIACSNPEYHCPDADCTAETLLQKGNVTDAQTGRDFFLDYPCDLQKGEDVVFVLSLHGGGSYANWQRHYFPLLDYKDQYRLIIATPDGNRFWNAEQDDEHLRNIVNYVYEKFAGANIRSFWLAGHSQGGATAHRLVCSEFFADRVDGLLSLAGGRVGMRAQPQACGYSHIFTTGELDRAGRAGVPESSPLAEQYGCDARVRREDVVDSKAGYVWDTRTGDARPNREGWGGPPAPGTAEVYEFPGCEEGRVVADVVRLKKGHTEGLEPNVTERLVELMLSATASKRGAAKTE